MPPERKTACPLQNETRDSSTHSGRPFVFLRYHREDDSRDPGGCFLDVFLLNESGPVWVAIGASSRILALLSGELKIRPLRSLLDVTNEDCCSDLAL